MPEKTPELSDAMKKKHDENITTKNQGSKFLAILYALKSRETLIFLKQIIKEIPKIGKNIERVTESSARQHKHLSLEGDKRLNLGWGLSSEKLYFLSNFLRAKLKK